MRKRCQNHSQARGKNQDYYRQRANVLLWFNSRIQVSSLTTHANSRDVCVCVGGCLWVCVGVLTEQTVWEPQKHEEMLSLLQLARNRVPHPTGNPLLSFACHLFLSVSLVQYWNPYLLLFMLLIGHSNECYKCRCHLFLISVMCHQGSSKTHLKCQGYSSVSIVLTQYA